MCGLDEGEVYTTGNNDYGQLGARGQGKHVVPMRVAALDTHIVTHIACGSTHTVAVTGEYQSCWQNMDNTSSIGFMLKSVEPGINTLVGHTCPYTLSLFVRADHCGDRASDLVNSARARNII